MGFVHTSLGKRIQTCKKLKKDILHLATDLGLFVKPYLSVPIGPMWIYPFLRSDLSTGFHLFDSREAGKVFTGLSVRIRGSVGLDLFINEWLGFSIMIAYDYLAGIKVGSFIPEDSEEDAAALVSAVT